MRLCPYCGHSNPEEATACRKCDGVFFSRPAPLLPTPRTYWIGPEKARVIRNRSLAAVALGLMVKVYWGGYGPWPVIDYPPWAVLRPWLEPLLLYCGGAGYFVGWVLEFI